MALNNDLFSILREEDKSGEFNNLIKLESEASFSPVAGYNLPSTKFNISYNRESNYYGYLLKTRDQLKRAVKRAPSEDRHHYDLLLRQVESSINLQ